MSGEEGAAPGGATLGKTLRCTISLRMMGWRVTSLPSSLRAEGDLPREETLQTRRVCGGGRSRGSGTAPPGGRAAADQEPGCTRAGLSRSHDTRLRRAPQTTPPTLAILGGGGWKGCRERLRGTAKPLSGERGFGSRPAQPSPSGATLGKALEASELHFPHF